MKDFPWQSEEQQNSVKDFNEYVMGLSGEDVGINLVVAYPSQLMAENFSEVDQVVIAQSERIAMLEAQVQSLSLMVEKLRQKSTH